MDIVYLLVPLSLVLILAIGAVLFWAIFRGQFDDVTQEATRILADDDLAR
ncbi:MAG: cbb3-type cytochrome oxidase assembly protein CcoS [Bacillota bacterium]